MPRDDADDDDDNDDASDDSGKDSQSEDDAEDGTRDDHNAHRTDVSVANRVNEKGTRAHAPARSLVVAQHRRATGNAHTRRRRQQRDRRALLQALELIGAQRMPMERGGGGVNIGGRGGARRNIDRGADTAVPRRDREAPSSSSSSSSSSVPRDRNRDRPDRGAYTGGRRRTDVDPIRPVANRNAHRQRVSLIDAKAQVSAYHEACRRACRDKMPLLLRRPNTVSTSSMTRCKPTWVRGATPVIRLGSTHRNIGVCADQPLPRRTTVPMSFFYIFFIH